MSRRTSRGKGLVACCILRLRFLLPETAARPLGRAWRPAATLWRCEREPRVEEFLKPLITPLLFLIVPDVDHFPGVKVRGETSGRRCSLALSLPMSTTFGSRRSSVLNLRLIFRRRNFLVDFHDGDWRWRGSGDGRRSLALTDVWRRGSRIY